MSDRYPDTPDGRYFVVRGRLWRKSNPVLNEPTRNSLVKDLTGGLGGLTGGGAGGSQISAASLEARRAEAFSEVAPVTL